jgi:hypothetical protein
LATRCILYVETTTDRPTLPRQAQDSDRSTLGVRLISKFRELLYCTVPSGGLFMCLFTSWKLSILAFTSIYPVIVITQTYAMWSSQLWQVIQVARGDASAAATEAFQVRKHGADVVNTYKNMYQNDHLPR